MFGSIDKTRLFIERARAIHGEKYDYSKVQYINSSTKVAIVCPIHGSFLQSPEKHLRGQGCPECGGTKKNTVKTFIEKARRVHGEKYDYSKVEYKNNKTPVVIICPEHGEFLQRPDSHLVGKGCDRCGGTYSYTTEEFINKARVIHKGKYDYSLTSYTGWNKPIKIICPVHGVFEQIPSNHLSGHGCIKCAGKEKINSSIFIERAHEIHGNKYDYSLVEYVNNHTPVSIICKKHGVFRQAPVNHINQRQGCPHCKVGVKTNREEFIKKAQRIFGNKYDYSMVEYKSRKEKVAIICSKHGVFYVSPKAHLQGHACPDCVDHHRKPKTIEEFVVKARVVHGNKYDYSSIKDISKEKVSISCPTHGVFFQSPLVHLKGKGCYFCENQNNKQRLNFIRRGKMIHNDKYDYSKVVYQDRLTKVEIICPEHGSFWQLPKIHLKGCGCIKCTGRTIFNKDDFIKKASIIHGNKYDYSKVIYVDTSTLVDIICPTHGLFAQTPNNHLRGSGCPRCKSSSGERAVRKYLSNHGFIFEEQKKFDDCRYKHRLPFDFYLPEQNICIEFNGSQHYSPSHFYGYDSFLEQQIRDKLKRDYCFSHDIPLIIIRFDEDVDKKLTELLKDLE